MAMMARDSPAPGKLQKFRVGVMKCESRVSKEILITQFALICVDHFYHR